MKLTAVVGARPNFVKIAPVLASLRQYPDVRTTLIHTGQHYDAKMSGDFFTELQIPPADLNLGVGSGPNAMQTAEIMLKLAPVLAADRPDLVLVVGDVNSTVAAAMVAVKTGIAIAHVEAGLRSFDRTMPEEINRILTDCVSDYCFTTEADAADNLVREGVDAGRIHFVGNVMIDTLVRFREQARHRTAITDLALTPGGYAVLTLHRPSNVDDPATLGQLLAGIAVVQRDFPVVFPVHPRTRERLHGLGVAEGLRLVEPLGYLDFIQLMSGAACVLTDSGGIQEETTVLGVPCLTLRENTERPVTLKVGTNRLVGLHANAIAAAWREIRRGEWTKGHIPELWDGHAAERIAKVIVR